MDKTIIFTEKDQKKYRKSKEYKDDIERLSGMKDEDIDYSDIPAFDEDFFRNVEVKRASKKDRLSMRLDHDILEYFKQKGKGYQTLINAVLRSYYEAHKN